MSVFLKINPKQAALDIVNDMWDGGELPVDPVRIARKMGIKVIESTLPEEASGALIKEAGKDPVIILNKDDSKNRRRFSCAHELGHYIYRIEINEDHYEYIDLRNHLSSAGDNEEEVFANQFAACLLMPEEEIRTFHRRLPIYLLGRHFGVSSDAMNFRLKGLKLS